MNSLRLRKNTTPIILVMVLVLFILPASAISALDDSGMTISLDAPPSRIVSLAPSHTEILATLGLLDRVVGVTDVCNYPPEVNTITRIGGYSAISIEKVSAARPDLVVASDITPQATVDRLRNLGLTVMVISPRDIDDMMRDIRMVGAITGTKSKAEELAAHLSERLAAIDHCSQGLIHPTVAHVVWHDPLYVSGNDTLQNDVILHAGGENVFSDRNGWSTVPLEEFLLKNPDIIIVSGGGGMDSSEKDVILEVFMTSPQYASLSAVKNHRVYAVDADIISRPAPRIVDATEQVARLLHPECFSDTAVPHEDTPAIPVTTPGFCAGSCILILSFAFILLQRRNP